MVTHIANNRRPEQHNYSAIAMLGINAGSSQLYQVRNLPFNTCHKELALAVVAADVMGLLG